MVLSVHIRVNPRLILTSLCTFAPLREIKSLSKQQPHATILVCMKTKMLL